jgi:hypothetical protein
MAKYFSRFPKVYYGFGDKAVDLLTNITVRFALEKKLKENTAAYYNYIIKEGETPEIIATKVYNSPERHWIILLMNDIIDVEEDWPLQYNSFNRFVDRKYSQEQYADTANTEVPGLIWSQQNTHSYYKVETTITPDGSSTERIVEIDEQSYDDLEPESNIIRQLADGNNITVNISKREKTFFDYETEINENKRTIKLIKNEFVFSLEEELINLFNE